MQQHLILLRRGESILKPVYGHADGKFGPPKYVKPKAFTVVEGLLGYHTEEMRNVCDVRVFLAPPEELRRRWKVNRDCTKRGYTTDQVLAELDKREDDSVSFIRPQEQLRRSGRLLHVQQRQEPRPSGRRADAARRTAQPRSVAVHRQRRRDHAAGAGRRAAATDPGPARHRACGCNRARDLGSDAVRQPPALAE